MISRVVGGKLTYFAVIEPGSSFLSDPVSIAVPDTGEPTLVVEGRVGGFVSSQSHASVSAASYTVTVLPDKDVYDQGEQIVLSGEARAQGGGLLAGATVQVRIASKGYARTLSTVTSAGGTYAVPFQPSPSEAGVFNLSASQPEAASQAVQSSFSISGLAFSPGQTTGRLSQDSNVSISVGLVNTGETSIGGLTYQVEGGAPGLELLVGGVPDTLLAGMRAPVGLRIEASTAAPIGTTTFELVVRESHGFERRLTVAAEVSASQPIPKVTPQAFELGMVAGETRIQSVYLENIGFSSWHDVTLSVPALSWVKIVGSAELGTINVGQRASFGLSFEPPSDLTPGQFIRNPLLEVASSNAQTVPINVGVTVTSSRQGNVTFRVINADKPRDAQGDGVPVSGAEVTLTSLEIAGLTFNAKADSGGAAAFTGVPTGEYSWRSQAEGFTVAQGVEVVGSGLTTQVEVLMLTAMVTYTWNVTETTIQDLYDITLNMTFKTDVPAPALVIDPVVVDLPLSVGQTMDTQYTITNKGLISAFNVTLTPAGAESGLELTVPFSVIPEIKPGQSIVVPVRAKLVHASCPFAKILQYGKYACEAGKEVVQQIQAFIVRLTGDAGGETCAPPGQASGGGVTEIAGQDPPTKPCICDPVIAGADYIRHPGPSQPYSVAVSGAGCSCATPKCTDAEWLAFGDLFIPGSNTGCSVNVEANGLSGGSVEATVPNCGTGSKTIIGCDSNAPITLSKTPEETTFKGPNVQLRAYARHCPIAGTWQVTSGGHAGKVGLRTGLFEPGPLPGEVKITFQETGGQQRQETITIDVLPTVEIIAVSPDLAACIGTPITLTARGLPSNTGIFTWKVDGTQHEETGRTADGDSFFTFEDLGILGDRAISVTYNEGQEKSKPASEIVGFEHIALDQPTFSPVPSGTYPEQYYNAPVQVTITAVSSGGTLRKLSGEKIQVIAQIAGCFFVQGTRVVSDGLHKVDWYCPSEAAGKLGHVFARCESQQNFFLRPIEIR